MKAIIVLVTLLLTCSAVVAEETVQEPKITRFWLNQAYGVARSADSATESGMKWLLYKYDEGSSESENPTLLDSVYSISQPQLCDSNAVSYFPETDTNTTTLMVLDLTDNSSPENIASFPIRTSRPRVHPGEILPEMDFKHYLYSSSDSLLFRFWCYPGRNFLEVLRILPNGNYEKLESRFEPDTPRFTGDFSQVLYSVRMGPGCNGYWRDPDLDRTEVIVYDLLEDTNYVARRVKGCCSRFQSLRRDDQPFCIRNDALDFNSFCVVGDSIPQPLLTVEYPVTFLGYIIYNDSVVVKTKNCCDKDYGIRSHVVLR